MVGVEWTGKYFLALSITTMVGVIADFGLTPVLVRDAANIPVVRKNFSKTFSDLKSVSPFSHSCWPVVITHAFGHDAQTRQLVYIATLVMALDTIHLTIYGVFRARHRLRHRIHRHFYWAVDYP